MLVALGGSTGVGSRGEGTGQARLGKSLSEEKKKGRCFVPLDTTRESLVCESHVMQTTTQVSCFMGKTQLMGAQRWALDLQTARFPELER